MTEVSYAGENVKEMIVNTCGEDGKDLWIRFILENGTKHDTYILKGSL